MLDYGNLRLYNYKYRCYDAYTGRFHQHDPLGIDPAEPHHNPFCALGQYTDGANLYEYTNGNPLLKLDLWGLKTKVFEGTLYYSDTRPKQEWNKANNPRIKYRVEMYYDCVGKNKLQAKHGDPKVTYSNLVGDLDNRGLSLIMVGATISDKVKAEADAQAKECLPQGRRCGVKMHIVVKICWIRRYSFGLNPGFGPISYDFGISWGKEATVKCAKELLIINCCRLIKAHKVTQ